MARRRGTGASDALWRILHELCGCRHKPFGNTVPLIALPRHLRSAPLGIKLEIE
jgi:hypothetical protein